MQQHSKDPAEIEAEIVHLRLLTIDALQRHWRVVFGRTPPADLSNNLLRRMIAWRLQERAFGGLDRESLRFLGRLARQGSSPRRQFKPGTVLVRDYQGQRYTVTVVPDGFDWQGTTYRSLSAIARAITGTVWNGPRFFALRRGKVTPANRTTKHRALLKANGSVAGPGVNSPAPMPTANNASCGN